MLNLTRTLALDVWMRSRPKLSTMAARPFDPADADRRRADEADLDRLRRRLPRDCTEQELEAALADLSPMGSDG
jgi:hypothetical protein